MGNGNSHSAIDNLINMNDLKGVLNELIISFFNKNLKDIESDINYYDFAVRYKLNMTAEEYRWKS